MNESTETPPPSVSSALPRRHEIDALRSIALLLLIIYHVFVAFQPFAPLVMFIGTSDTLENAWFLGELLSPWRVPVLFLIAGITAGYLLQNRPVGKLVKSRLMRLVPPLLFTCLCIAPISPALYLIFQGQTPTYMPNPGHLWFVWNLVVYFVFGVPLFLYLKVRPDNLVVRLAKVLSPYGWLLLLPAVLTLTTWFLEPHISTEMFSTHFLRFWHGFACFVSGVVLVSLGDHFWQGILRVCHVALPAALALYLMRMAEVDFGGKLPGLTLRTMESVYGMLAFLGYGSLAFTRPSRLFTVLNRSVFAVYIIHMPVQQAVGFFLFPLEWNAGLAFALHLVATLSISALIYTFVLRPMRWLHPFFGIAPLKPPPSPAASTMETTPSQPSWPVVAGRFATLYIASPILVLAMIGALVSSAIFQSSATGSHEAALNGNLEAIRQHIKSGANLNEKDQLGGSSPLIIAATFGRTEVAKALIEAGADIDQKNNDGSTALHIAALFCRTEIVQALLEKGANKGLKNNAGSTARELVSGSFDSMKGTYDLISVVLKPLGLELDYKRIEATRPRIAKILE